ncbi:hypothetical protein IPdc08_01876 [archaeon]|nr:hypothetical protein IPdc08_01876 [archaeon]
MLGRFLKDEKGQGAIEYIMLAGGIIVAAIIIFVIYKNAATKAGNVLTNATTNVTYKESTTIVNQLSKF